MVYTNKFRKYHQYSHSVPLFALTQLAAGFNLLALPLFVRNPQMRKKLCEILRQFSFSCSNLRFEAEAAAAMVLQQEWRRS